MNILITGAATGIGLKLAQFYKIQGHTVGILSVQSKEDVPELVQSFHYFKVDVTNSEELQRAVDLFVSRVGSLDLIIANAGLNMPKTTIPDTIKGKALTMVNVLGVVHTFNSSLPYFLKQKSGHFVAISSLSAFNGLPGMSFYGASKAFVANFCESLAIDLRDKNIFVTCLFPGFIATDFTKENAHPMPFLLTPDQAVKKITKAISQKKEILAFPLAPALFMWLLRRLPRFLYFPLMRKDILNLRQH
ncbi:MAG: SDR family NAD(P)-dependent oxidoreductase [Bacteriovoracaceae bacterium]